MRQLICVGFLFALAATTSLTAADPHLTESGIGVLVSRSAFAHGYRHGYEAGYHQGNIDVNMARPPKNKPAEFKGIPIRYEPAFGSRHSFEIGFQAGLKAGYSDGYAGRVFRAVTAFRSLASTLDSQVAGDLTNTSFDRGISSGYVQGLDRGLADTSSNSPLDFEVVSCPKANVSIQQALQVYCEGYRRGYALGRADGRILRPERPLLEASR